MTKRQSSRRKWFAVGKPAKKSQRKKDVLKPKKLVWLPCLKYFKRTAASKMDGGKEEHTLDERRADGWKNINLEFRYPLSISGYKYVNR